MSLRLGGRVLLAGGAVVLALVVGVVASDPSVRLRARLRLAQCPRLQLRAPFHVLEESRSCFDPIPAEALPASLRQEPDAAEPWSRCRNLYLHRYVKDGSLVVRLYALDGETATLLVENSKFLG